MRDHLQHGGQAMTSFTTLAELQKTSGSGYILAFDTYKSSADFNADGNEIPGQRFRFDPATGFAQANAALLVQVRDLMLNEMGLGGRNFTFTEFQWFPVQRVLTVSADKGEQHVVFTKRGVDYDAFRTANDALFDALNQAAWTHAKANNTLLNAMTPAV